MKVSVLTPYSYGVVAANKPLSSMDIEVTPMEDMTMANGELTDNITSTNTKGKDADGSSFETTIKSSITLTARWLPMGSNRKTAPDVRRGEKVLIWRFADADKYYWSSLEYNPKLRKLETVIFGISNTQNEDDDATGDNTYFIEMSTHSKRIHLHTSTSDGEPYGYDFVFNTKDGNVMLQDTIENLIFLDSAAKRIVLKNAEGTYLDLNAADLIVNVMGNMTTKVAGDMTTMVTGTYSLQADGAYKVKSPTVDYVTPQMTTSEKFTCGADALLGANATVKGSLTLGGGMSTGASGGGDISLNGSITASGGATFTQAVSAPNIH